MKRKFLGVAAATLVSAGLLASSAPSAKNTAFDDSAKLRKAVGADGVTKHLEKFDDIALANDNTRASGTPGYDRSADYVARVMRDKGYEVERQEFTFDLFSQDGPSEFERISPDPTTFTEDTDFDLMEFSGNTPVGGITAAVTAVDLVIPPGPTPSTSNSGCEAADFAGFPAGSIALTQRGTCDFADKVDNAFAAGAVGVLVFNEGQPGREDLLLGTLAAPLRDGPVFGLPFDVGADLANGATNGPTGVTVRMESDTSAVLDTPTENVIATSKKGDPDDIVMAGAHLDSVAEGPGINDNGSGSAGILEIAKQMAKLQIKPKNKVRFAWWGAEESGLIGSTEYVAQLTEEEGAEIAAYLNFDMIGSPNFARFIYDGNGSAFDLEGPPGSDTIERTFQRYFERKDLASGQTAFDGRSDYKPFIDVGIPAGGLFTGAEDEKTDAQAALYGGTPGEAFDPCYHAACDDIENVSKRALEQMTDAAAHTIHKFAFDLKFVRETEAAPRAAREANQSSTGDRIGDDYVR